MGLAPFVSRHAVCPTARASCKPQKPLGTNHYRVPSDFQKGTSDDKLVACILATYSRII